MIVLGFVSEVNAQAQRRGRTVAPQMPVSVNSSAMIDDLNKVLKSLGATDRDYDGHRDTAIKHISNAIKDMEVPNPKGQGEKGDNRASASKPTAKSDTVAPAESDANLRKALHDLYAVHHDLEKKGLDQGSHSRRRRGPDCHPGAGCRPETHQTRRGTTPRQACLPRRGRLLFHDQTRQVTIGSIVTTRPQPPESGRDQLDGVASRVAEIERPAPPRPVHLLLDRDPVAGERITPEVERIGGDPEGEVPGPAGPRAGRV